MDNNLFSGTQAMDETYLCAELGHDRATERLKVHRDEFITERDFEEIAFMGFNAVRIPVPFFLFEDLGPYVHCYEYLDKAFNWSEKYGLKILVELHTVPGGHNGTDNAGICGICIWSTRIEQVNYALWVLEKIAERYGKREALWGIGVLNEPMCCDIEAGQIFNIHNFVQFYKPVDEKLAESNTNYSLAFLQEFYRDAYKVIRKHTSAKIVFSDAFELDIWDDFLKEFKDVVLDTHNYLMTADMLGLCQRNVEAYVDYLQKLGERVNATAKRIPLIVGEWNAQNQTEGLADMSDAEKSHLYSTIVQEFQKGMSEVGSIGAGKCT